MVFYIDTSIDGHPIRSRGELNDGVLSKEEIVSALNTFSNPTSVSSYMTNGNPLGLCDSNGVEFRVGSIVRRDMTNNSEIHGDWVDYEVKLQGTVPLLSYLKSEKGQINPVGYTVGFLSNEYDHKEFLFSENSKSLRPDESLIILDV